jgi:O-antigen/teichoic acid export membrane protein
MNYKLKEFAKDSVLYATGQWIGKLGGLILVPILSRIFLPSDYGLIDLLNTSYLFTLMFISLNIDSGVQKYYFLREGEKRKILLSSTMVFRLIFSSMVAGFVVIFSQKLSQLVFHKTTYGTEIALLAIALPFEDIYTQLMLLLRLNRSAVSFSVYNICQVIIQPILTYVLVVDLQQNLKGVFIAKLATIIIITVPLLLQQRSYYGKVIRFREAIGIMKFSVPGLPDIVQGNVMDLLPRYLLAYYSNLTAVGLYGIANRIANTVEMFKSSFNRAWNPFAFSNAGKADEKYLYENVFRLFAFCLLLLITTLTFFAKDILSILTPPKYHSASMLVGGICIYFALRALTLIYSTGLYSVNKVAHTSLLATIQLVVFVASAVVLVPKFSAAGLVLSLDVSAAVHFICYSLTVRKYFSFNISSSRLLGAFALSLSGGWYVSYISAAAGHVANLTIFFQKLALLFLYALLSYYIILTRSEKKDIWERIKSLFAFLV